MEYTANRIPKIIHYCWFGGKPLPELAQKCISSWQKYLPDYEIKEWNESNYDVHKTAYTSEAYNAKKYAFVSDYARFDILYQHGGIYFDTDVEVIKPFDDILKYGGFMGFESDGAVASGLGIGVNPGLGIVRQILDFYRTLHFTNNTSTVVGIVSGILVKNGLLQKNTIQKMDGLTIYPNDYFAPKSYTTGILSITKNTHSIHHYDASWLSKRDKAFNAVREKVFARFGENGFSWWIVRFLFLIKRIADDGICIAAKFYYRRIFLKRL
jgi:hypothetical protein